MPIRREAWLLLLRRHPASRYNDLVTCVPRTIARVPTSGRLLSARKGIRITMAQTKCDPSTGHVPHPNTSKGVADARILRKLLGVWSREASSTSSDHTMSPCLIMLCRP
jgi:hypothetical protein